MSETSAGGQNANDECEMLVLAVFHLQTVFLNMLVIVLAEVEKTAANGDTRKVVLKRLDGGLLEVSQQMHQREVTVHVGERGQEAVVRCPLRVGQQAVNEGKHPAIALRMNGVELCEQLWDSFKGAVSEPAVTF